MKWIIWINDLFSMIETICIALMALGSWLIILNWGCLYAACIRKKPSPSWIPVVPGFLLFSGIWFYPENTYAGHAWIAFVVDWGSLPGMLHTAYSHFDMARKIRNK